MNASNSSSCSLEVRREAAAIRSASSDGGADSRLGKTLDHTEVQALFRQAIAHDDDVAMRRGLEHVLGLNGANGGLSAEQEYLLRHPDYVMEMPQSNERIRGREAMRAMQEAFPTPPNVRLRRVLGSGRTWVIEGVNDYDGDVWNVVLILELDQDGLIR